MNTVRDHTFPAKHEAQRWLDGLPNPETKCAGNAYYNEPLFKCESAEAAVSFLLRCAAYEELSHIQDEEMNGVLLTIGFEFGSIASNCLDLAFTFSNGEDSGSISFSLTTCKQPDGSFQIFGDDEFRNVK